MRVDTALKEWPVVTLSDVLELKYGKRLAAASRSGEGFPVYGSNGVVGAHKETVTQGPTIIVGRKGSYGQVNYSSGECWPIDTTYYVDETCTSAHLRWLTHLLPTLGLDRMNKSAAIPGLSREDAYRVPILLPPLDEQRRIAAILDKADELRTKRREALAHLDTLTQSIFHSMFGDPTDAPQQRALGELLASIDSGSSPVSADRPAENDEWGILKLSAVTSQTYREMENKALLATAPDRRHEVRTGDVLFTRKNTPNLVAAVAMVRKTRSKLLLPDLIFRLNIADRQTLEPEYLHAVLSYPTQRSSVQRLAGGAAASMSNISKAKLLTVSIPVPPLELQQTFATRIAAVERLKGLHRRHLAELDALFASLQHRAFRGEL